jgi:hypothetical protein
MSMDYLRYALDALDILEESIQLAAEGHAGFYRVAAAQLRLLLCDTTRQHGKIIDISLLPRLLPELKLPSVDQHSFIATKTDEIPLADWLKQKLVMGESTAITIRELIRLVCDQDGGAHVDYKPQSILRSELNYQQLILTIAKVVLISVRTDLKSPRS